MTYFYSQSVSAIETSNGRKKKTFSVVKGKNNTVEEIQGISTNNNPNVYNIKHKVQKVNRMSGDVHMRQKLFKLKSSNIQDLLRESRKHNLETQKKDKHKKIIIVIGKKYPVVSKETPPKVAKKSVRKVTKKPVSKVSVEQTPKVTKKSVSKVSVEQAPKGTKKPVPKVSVEQAPKVTKKSVPKVSKSLKKL